MFHLALTFFRLLLPPPADCSHVYAVLPAVVRGRDRPFPLRPNPVLCVRPLLHHPPLAPGLRLHGLSRGPGRLLLPTHALGPTHPQLVSGRGNHQLLPAVRSRQSKSLRKLHFGKSQTKRTETVSYTHLTLPTILRV